MIELSQAFGHGKAFIPFITCGDPDLETTGRIIREAVRNGADLIELGIPFSDPTAEGPVIMEADRRALAGGVTTDDILSFAKELRKDVKVPMIFMTYANVVYSYGPDMFCEKAAEADVRGLLLCDVPYEEKQDFLPACEKHGISLISMIAPTSENRIGMIAKEAQGFIYIVSSLGVTGVRKSITTDISPIVDVIRKNTNVPCAVGFGISTPEQARKMASLSDGAIVGSAIIKIIDAGGPDMVKKVGEYVKSMKDAISDL